MNYNTYLDSLDINDPRRQLVSDYLDFKQNKLTMDEMLIKHPQFKIIKLNEPEPDPEPDGCLY